MANGDNPWTDIKEIRRDLTNLAKDGCGHKEWHEKVSEAIRSDLTAERRDREAMGEKLFTAIGKVGQDSIKEMKAIRNQIMGSLVLVLVAAIIVSKVLK